MKECSQCKKETTGTVYHLTKGSMPYCSECWDKNQESGAEFLKTYLIVMGIAFIGLIIYAIF